MAVECMCGVTAVTLLNSIALGATGASWSVLQQILTGLGRPKTLAGPSCVAHDPCCHGKCSKHALSPKQALFRSLCTVVIQVQ